MTASTGWRGRLTAVSSSRRRRAAIPDVWIMSSGRIAPRPAHVRRRARTSARASRRTASTSSSSRTATVASRLWRMGLDGSGATRLSADLVARGRGTISPDGKWVYYSEAAAANRARCRSTAGRRSAVVQALAAAQLPAGLPRADALAGRRNRRRTLQRSDGARAHRADTGRRRTRRSCCRRCRRARRGHPTAKRSSTSTRVAASRT